MKQDIENNMKYILENISDLGLSPINKEYIDKIVEILKFQVRSNYIYTTLSENEKLVKHVETVLKTINDEETKINKEIDKVLEELEFKYKEYTPANNEDKIFPGLKAKLEENRKKNYENEKNKAEKEFEEKKIFIEDKLNELKAEKDTIEDLKDQIISTDKFIDINLNVEFDADSYNNNYKKIINDCAISILGNDVNTENAEKLFTLEDGNYIPNHDSLLDYFEVARNPELSSELLNFYDSLKNVEVSKNIAQKNDENYYQSLSKREDIKEALNDKKNIQQVENDFLSIHDLFNSLKELHLNKIKNALDVIGHQNTKPKINIFDKFLKKDNEDEKITKDNKDEKTIFNELLEEYHNINKLEEDNKVGLVYEFYIMLAHSKINIDDVKKNLNDIPDYSSECDNKELEEISLIYTLLEKYDIYDLHKMISEIIDSKVDEVQSSYEENLKNLNDYKSKEDSLIESLSEKAKEYYEKFSNEYSLKSFNDLSSKNLSPLIASLILEIIFYIDDIKTPEDISKFGIEVSDEEIKEYKDLITNTILPNMENFLNNSMNIILVKNS